MAKKILIIEDEEILADLLEKKLTQVGYEVSVANDGVEGLDKVKESIPDLILLDIVMPRMGGFDVMRELQKNQDFSKIPIVIISNSGQPVELDLAQKLGAKDWLIKTDFDPQEVLDKVVKQIGKYKRSIWKKVAYKILVVEDDKFLRELISQKLTREGYDVKEAIDGEDGVVKVKEEKPDIILLDLILPGMDGFEVLAKIKDDPEVENIPVVILSNLGQRDDVERGLKLGAVDFLIKAHFTPGEIIEKIEKVMKEAGNK